MKPMTDAEFREMVRKAQVAHYYFAMGHRGDDTPYGTRDTCVNIYADLRADNERLRKTLRHFSIRRDGNNTFCDCCESVWNLGVVENHATDCPCRPPEERQEDLPFDYIVSTCPECGVRCASSPENPAITHRDGCSRIDKPRTCGNCGRENIDGSLCSMRACGCRCLCTFWEPIVNALPACWPSGL